MNKKSLFAVVFLLVAVLLVGCDLSPTESASAGSLGGGEVARTAVYPVESGYPPGLVVVGTGTVESDPDIAYLTLGVDIKESEPSLAVNDASSRMERILAAVQGAGIAEEDIRTANYNLWVEQGYDPQTGRPTDEINYHVIHTVRIAVRNLDQVGTILSAAVEAGANSISNVSFSIEDPEALNTQARQLAIADAQEKAQEMATALDVSLGKVISISESGGVSPVVYTEGRGGGAAYEVPAAVPMPAGSFTVSISVVVVYELP